MERSRMFSENPELFETNTINPQKFQSHISINQYQKNIKI